MPKLKSLATLTTTAGALALGFVLWTAPALAQSNDQVEILNRINRLDNDIQTLHRQLARGGGAAPGAIAPAPAPGAIAPTQAADFEIRLSQLERSVQEAVGKYEEAVFGVAQLRERLDKLSSDLDFRLSQLESRTGTEGGPPPPPRTPPTTTQPARPAQPAPPAGKPGEKRVEPAPPGQPAAVSGPGLGTVAGNVQEQYDEAFGLLRKADYDQAEKALSKFVTQHRDSPLSGNAQYWLGETYYVRGKYAEAAVAFAEGFQKYPKNPKAPDNLLKLGLSLSALGQKDDSCKTLKQLDAVFPTAAASLKRRAEQERKRLGCS
ncbi:MAG: tol-pal system protein YbgF [Rhodospirillaceae bacterium]